VSVTDIENGVERAEKAVEALVYGTVGLALYVRDTAPSFIKLFVARGKNELGQQGKSVGDQLGQVKNLGDQLGQVKALGDMAAQSAPQILRVVGDQVGRLRERAEDVIAGFGAQPPGASAPPPPYSPAPPRTPPSPPSAAPTPPPPSATAAAAAAASATGTEISGNPSDAPPTSWRSSGTSGAPSSGTDAATGLAITDYDELSASQVVDRLEGLPRHELEAIRDYERAHRARNTILGKIEQLTR
jgi:hypothetical protein